MSNGGNGFNKRQKERARKEKQDEKLAKKAARRAGLLPSSDGDAVVEGSAQEGVAADGTADASVTPPANEPAQPTT